MPKAGPRVDDPDHIDQEKEEPWNKTEKKKKKKKKKKRPRKTNGSRTTNCPGTKLAPVVEVHETPNDVVVRVRLCQGAIELSVPKAALTRGSGAGAHRHSSRSKPGRDSKLSRRKEPP